MSELSKTIIRADTFEDPSDRKKAVESALEAGYDTIIICESDLNLKRLARYTALIKKDDDIYINEEKIGQTIKINNKTDAEKAYSASVSLLIVEFDDFKVIPLENLIVRFQNTNTKVYASVNTPEEAELALRIMESGTNGIAINPGSTDLSEFSKILAGNFTEIKPDEATITGITPLKLGNRVCIDTCSLIEKGEGMFIGSKSSGLFLVCSESFESEYVNSRPFRVNAGSVHSYILCPDGTTKYLSEIKAGSGVLIAKADGSLHEAVTGRVKIEVRPMLMIEAVAFGKTYSVVLQNAETVRLASPNGAVSVSDLEVGDKVYLRLEDGARHMGHPLKESITEK